MAFSLGIANIFKSSTEPQPAVPTPEAALDQAEKALFDKKAELLEQVSAAAREQNRKPTLEDYRLAAEAFARTEEGQKMLEGNAWAPIMADLSGQTLKGFRISEPEKTKDGFKIPDPDTGVATQLLDLDGDGAIGDFYANTKFVNAKFTEKTEFHPATSFNHKITEAALLEDITFNGMQAFNEHGEANKFTFGNTVYKNITLTNITGGEIAFEGSNVTNLNMEGAKVASIIMGEDTVIHHLNAKDARIVTLNAEPGVQIMHADFSGATIDMASNLKGVTLTDVKFKDSNLTDVDLTGATLTNVKFQDSHLTDLNLSGAKLNKVQFKDDQIEGLNLSGAELTNVKIGHQAITDLAQLKELGIKVDDTTKIAASPEFLKESKQEAAMAAIKDVRNTANKWQEQLGGAAPEPKAPAATVDASMDQFTAMNRNINKAPVTNFEQPLSVLAGLLGDPALKQALQANFGNMDFAANDAPAASVPSRGNPAPAKSSGDFDRDYFRRMSETNGRAKA